ncbi:MAG: MerR family transcriptional regulator [Gemmatimonadota bacterium]|nr:MerR family transcriptional regulator [Gemmatimonadota bacterium]MDH3421720.1 MerR family transcriptional regulator [Gemmatimonadota bacterium]
MSHDASTPRHPIRVVAHRTGLTPAAIRAWERRYDAVSPARSEGGQRVYSDRDVDRLNTLRALVDMGRSISTVAALPPAAAEALLSEDIQATPAADRVDPSEAQDEWIDDAYQHMVELDAEALERTLWRAFLSLGAQPFLEGVAAPLLSRVGHSWAGGLISPAQEHLGSGVLERVLAWMSDPAMSSPEGPTVVVATLPGERHALGARLAAVAAAVAGWRPTYLGADLPISDIANAAHDVGADAVAISAVRTDQMNETASSVFALRELLKPEISLMVGGTAARLLKAQELPSGVEVFDGLDGFATVDRNGRGA